MKQETLEEAAERYANNQSDTSMRKDPLEFSKSGEELWEEAKEDFKAGAKWQAEKLLAFVNDEDNHTEGELGNSCIDVQTLVNFIEQFKK